MSFRTYYSYGTSSVHSGNIRTPDLRRLAIQSGFRLHALARQAGMSAKTLRRRIAAKFHLTTERWLVQLRMELAPRYLRQWKKVMVVALKLDYRQLSHFCRHFKQHYRTTVQRWRKWRIRRGRRPRSRRLRRRMTSATFRP